MDATTPPLVLIVDDDELLRLVIVDLLGAAGYQTLEAADAMTALDLCHTHRPACIVLDALMPGMDGFACCRKLRSLTSTRDLPILMLTALSDVNTADRVTAAGATGYIEKPFNGFQLLERIATLIPSSGESLS